LYGWSITRLSRWRGSLSSTSLLSIEGFVVHTKLLLLEIFCSKFFKR
jgi:hypothetical protein